MTDGGGTTCSNCNGYGMVGYASPAYSGTAECPECGGTGTVEEADA